MKLTFYQGVEPNFGDELNLLIWDKLLPSGFLDQTSDDLFLGIGSILWDDLPKDLTKHVLGSGFGGYTSVPNVHDGSWNIVWVRGPRTAQALAIDSRFAITDSAVLLRAIDLPEPAHGVDVAFMPHFQSIARGNWAEACELAGITFLDPRDPPLEIISKMRGAKLILTEAMHGAIVADALRTPFVPFVPIRPEHRMKWDDWSESVELSLNKQRLKGSSLVDLYVEKTRAYGSGPVSRFLGSNPITKMLNVKLTMKAAEHLSYVAQNVEPMLSCDHIIEVLTERCLASLSSFVKSRGPIPQ